MQLACTKDGCKMVCSIQTQHRICTYVSWKICEWDWTLAFVKMARRRYVIFQKGRARKRHMKRFIQTDLSHDNMFYFHFVIFLTISNERRIKIQCALNICLIIHAIFYLIETHASTIPRNLIVRSRALPRFHAKGILRSNNTSYDPSTLQNSEKLRLKGK